MKPTAINQAVFTARKARILREILATHPGRDISRGEETLADLKVRYPHLMKKVAFRVATKPLAGGRALGFTALKNSYETGGGPGQWLKAKAQPKIVIASGATLRTGAHELKHAAEYLKQSNRRIMGKALLTKVFVPYGFRPEEWRANRAGMRVANTSAEGQRRTNRRMIRGGIKGSLVRTGSLTGTIAAIRALKKRKQANVARRQSG